MAAVARAALMLALVVAGCSSTGAHPSTGSQPTGSPNQSPSVETSPSPETSAETPVSTAPMLTAPLAVADSGSAELGSFQAGPGDLWVGGRCSGGDLEVRVDPVAVLPIPCEALAGGPFLNQIVMVRLTTVTVSVAAPATATWELEVRQD